MKSDFEGELKVPGERRRGESRKQERRREWIEPQNIELRNVECRRVESLRDVVFILDSRSGSGMTRGGYVGGV